MPKYQGKKYRGMVGSNAGTIPGGPQFRSMSVISVRTGWQLSQSVRQSAPVTVSYNLDTMAQRMLEEAMLTSKFTKREQAEFLATARSILEERFGNVR